LSFSSFIEYCLCRLRHLFSSELCSLLGAPRLCLSPLLGTTASPFSSLIYSVNFTTLPFLALLIMRGTTASPFSPFIEYSLCQLRHLFSFKLCSLSGALRLRRSSLLSSLAFVGFDTSSFQVLLIIKGATATSRSAVCFPGRGFARILFSYAITFSV